MFRSFFPEPKLFFSSAALWMLLAVLAWFTIGAPLRTVISLDHILVPTISAPAETAAPATPEAPPTATAPAPDQATTAPADTPAAGTAQTNPNAPAATESAVQAAAGAQEASVATFLNGERIWLYQYVLMAAVLFCVFWYFYRRNEWYWWSVVGSTGILLIIYFQVQVDAFINEWSGVFFDMIQQALTVPRSVSPENFYREVFTLFAVITPSILVSVMLAFFTSHYVFRWRKAMTTYYMLYWPALRTTEGAAQR
ncbi:MAG TPA: SbmA/BacA-like family transporter, partial [Devosia sp.]|nr:SbmA/BacA-like family transporter [Devosia sp.]